MLGVLRGISIADIIRNRHGKVFIKKYKEMALGSEVFVGFQEKQWYSKVSPF